MPIQRIKGNSLSGKLRASGINLADTFAFTGTVTGATGWRQETKSADNSATNLAFDIAAGAEIIFVTLENLYKSGSTNTMLQIGNAAEFPTNDS